MCPLLTWKGEWKKASRCRQCDALGNVHLGNMERVQGSDLASSLQDLKDLLLTLRLRLVESIGSTRRSYAILGKYYG